MAETRVADTKVVKMKTTTKTETETENNKMRKC